VAIEGASWSFLTKKEHQNQIAHLIKDSGLKIRDLDFIHLPDDFNPHAAGAYMLQGFLHEIKMCITYGAQFLTAPPDTIFGNGSIANMREMARARDTVVFVPHVRVCPQISTELSTSLSNAQLVGAAWRHLHKTWSEAQDGLLQINSFIGGVSWNHLRDGLYSVSHRLPTPYLINFTPEDLVFFKNQIHFGCIDHEWPSELIPEERMRVVGSSDAAFMVEITEPDQNVPPLEYYRHDSPDHFWRQRPHNKINRMFRSILRAE